MKHKFILTLIALCFMVSGCKRPFEPECVRDCIRGMRLNLKFYEISKMYIRENKLNFETYCQQLCREVDD